MPLLKGLSDNALLDVAGRMTEEQFEVCAPLLSDFCSSHHNSKSKSHPDTLSHPSLSLMIGIRFFCSLRRYSSELLATMCWESGV